MEARREQGNNECGGGVKKTDKRDGDKQERKRCRKLHKLGEMTEKKEVARNERRSAEPDRKNPVRLTTEPRFMFSFRQKFCKISPDFPTTAIKISPHLGGRCKIAQSPAIISHNILVFVYTEVEFAFLCVCCYLL